MTNKRQPWDIDDEMRLMEPPTNPGTVIERVRMDIVALAKEGIEPTPKQQKLGYATLWRIGIGKADTSRSFFYGNTIRQAVENANRGISDLRKAWYQERRAMDAARNAAEITPLRGVVGAGERPWPVIATVSAARSSPKTPTAPSMGRRPRPKRSAASGLGRTWKPVLSPWRSGWPLWNRESRERHDQRSKTRRLGVRAPVGQRATASSTV